MLQPIYHCGVGQALAELKDVSAQMFIDAGGYVNADKSVIIYVHGVINENAGYGLFGYPSFPDFGPYSLTVQGFTGKYTDEIICFNTGTTIGAANFTFKNIKFTGGVRVPWLIGRDNCGHDNCIFDNAYQAHYETTNGFMRNNLIMNVGYSALNGYSKEAAKPMIIENNIVYGVPGGYDCFLQHNCIFRKNFIIGGGNGLMAQSAPYAPYGPVINHKCYDNLIINAGTGVHFFASNSHQGYQFYNNTIANCGYAIQANYLINDQNLIKNNLLIVGAGQYGIQFDNDNHDQYLDYNFYDIDATGNCAQIHNGAIWQNFATLAALIAAYPQYEAHGVQGSAEIILPGTTDAQNYRLKANSGAIDKGLDLSAIIVDDYNGKSRPKKAGFDCGCFEAPYITLTGVLSDYSIEQAEYLQATATITGTATAVYVVINGKTFPLTATGGGVYTLAIRGFDIGICAGASVVFYAFNDDYNITFAAPALTVIATDNYNIGAIETSIMNILNTITDFKSVLQNEPKQIPALPAATLYYDGFNQSQTEAVSFTITHKWILRLYVKLHDAEDAQIQLKLLVGKVLAALKLDLDFGNTVLFGFSDSGSVVVLMDRDAPVMIAELNLTGLLEVD